MSAGHVGLACCLSLNGAAGDEVTARLPGLIRIRHSGTHLQARVN